jgi:DNA-binding transcriptional ArsR family regulator
VLDGVGPATAPGVVIVAAGDRRAVGADCGAVFAVACVAKAGGQGIARLDCTSGGVLLAGLHQFIIGCPLVGSKQQCGAREGYIPSMRSVAPALLPIFRSSHQAGLLCRLFLTDDEIPMTDLAYALGIPLTTLHRETERLEQAGLLMSRRSGRTRLLRANRRHPAATPLTDLLTVTFGPAQVIADEFGELGADTVVVHGCWAQRYAGQHGSFPAAVEVLVVGDDLDDDAVHVAAAGAQRRLGLPVTTAICTRGSWQTSRPDPEIATIRAHPFLTVLTAPGPSPADPSRHPGGVYRLRPSWTPRYQPDVYVPADLSMLTGPTSGHLDPPVHLYWQPGNLDFAKPADRELFYSSALTTAHSSHDFTQWINREALTAAWHHLSLPTRVRRAWETLHPHLRDEATIVNDRIRIQDTILAAIAEFGFALAGGSALIDYDVVSRETDDIDAFNDRWDVAAFTAACARVLQVCHENGWNAALIGDQDMDKRIRVDAGTGHPVIVQLVYYGRSQDPEQRPGGGLRLIFDDVVAGKGAAIADVARGRDFYDLANIMTTPGWTLERVESAMHAMRFGDLIDQFRANIDRFRRGEFDDDIRKSGFDPNFCHRTLD